MQTTISFLNIRAAALSVAVSLLCAAPFGYAGPSESELEPPTEPGTTAPAGGTTQPGGTTSSGSTTPIGGTTSGGSTTTSASNTFTGGTAVSGGATYTSGSWGGSFSGSLAIGSGSIWTPSSTFSTGTLSYPSDYFYDAKALTLTGVATKDRGDGTAAIVAGGGVLSSFGYIDSASTSLSGSWTTPTLKSGSYKDSNDNSMMMVVEDFGTATFTGGNVVTVSGGTFPFSTTTNGSAVIAASAEHPDPSNLEDPFPLPDQIYASDPYAYASDPNSIAAYQGGLTSSSLTVLSGTFITFGSFTGANGGGVITPPVITPPVIAPPVVQPVVDNSAVTLTDGSVVGLATRCPVTLVDGGTATLADGSTVALAAGSVIFPSKSSSYTFTNGSGAFQLTIGSELQLADTRKALKIVGGDASVVAGTGTGTFTIGDTAVPAANPALSGSLSDFKINVDADADGGATHVKAKIALINHDSQSLHKVTATVYLSDDNLLSSDDIRLVTLKLENHVPKGKIHAGRAASLLLKHKVPEILASDLNGKYIIVDLSAGNLPDFALTEPIVYGPIQLP